MNGIGSFKLKLVAWFALLALLPLAVAFGGYSSLARRSETRRADAELQAGLRAVAAAYAARLDDAAAEARRLARRPAVQRALREHDSAALARLLPPRPDGLAASRSVTVVDGGRALGRVTIAVPVDGALLASLARALSPQERLVAARHGRIVAGPRSGSTLPLSAAAPARVTLGRVSYRGLESAPGSDPAGLAFAVLTPQTAIDAAAHASERTIVLGLLGGLVIFIAATYILGRSIVSTLRRLADAALQIAHGRFGERVEVRGRDEFGQLGAAFNHMAAQLEQRLAELETERTRLRAATARFGAALSATHDPDQLVRIAVESAVEATGAAGGVVLGPKGELARTGDPDVASERIAVPLRVGTSPSSDFGSLVLASDAFGEEQMETATSLAGQVAIALDNARLHRLVEQQARVDSLTGLANRRSVEESLRVELARAARYDDHVCLVFADLDNFKQVNDRYGHAAGDEVLQAFATVLRETVRESDAAARWGGEEFALVLPGADVAGGARLAERARSALARRTITVGDGQVVSPTASFGVAAFPDVRGIDELLAAADAAVYDAKRSGKDRVCVFAGFPV